MAEALVDPPVGGLIEALHHKVAHEANVVISFKNDFQWLSYELKYLKGFLRDAGGQSRHNNSVNVWLHEIEDVAYDADDIFEECILAGSDADISHCFCSYTQFLFRYRMGRRIKDVKDRIKSIHEDAEELKLYQDQTDGYTRISTQRYREKSSILTNQSQTVGMEEKIDMIIGWLNDPDDRVIAVVGMGGLGKTFLLHHVFQRAKGSFSTSIWLSIFQDYSLKQLQSDIGQKIGLSELKDVSVEAAAESIDRRLQGQRSLIVLDDVWREDRLVERIGLPVERSCKIIISSRMKELCTKMGARVYDMELLSEENIWKLFCFHAFPDCGQTPPQEIEEVARAIEQKCGRLPLAVKTVAASMALIKRLPNEWEFRLRRLNEVEIPYDIRPILRLTYDALPSYLKLCFVYCSAFPENSEIDVEYLINLWLAEGFIQTENKEDLMDVAISYETWGQRRISLRGGEERSISLTNKCPGLRTLLLRANRIIEDPIPARFIGNLKSLRVLDLSWTGICCDFLERLPEEIGELNCLKHLDAIECRRLDSMPRGISMLTSLETLRGIKFFERKSALRIEDLKGLIQLRDLQLTIDSEDEDVDMGSMIEGLVKMRTLSLEQFENSSVHFSEKMASLKELEHLKLRCYSVVPNCVCSFQNLLVLILKHCHCTDYPALETMPNLRFLTLWWNNRCLKLRTEFGKSGGFPKLELLDLMTFRRLEEFPKLEDGAMPCLKSLTVWNCERLKKRPDGIEQLINLEEIDVDDCGGWETMKAGREDWKKLKDRLLHVGQVCRSGQDWRMDQWQREKCKISIAYMPSEEVIGTKKESL
eukprot:Gb_25803 [translate_table: standard]